MKKPKGKMIIIGGAESKGDESELEMAYDNREYVPFEILKELLPPEISNNKTLEIITTASQVPEEVEAMYKEAFNTKGFYDIAFMHMNKRSDSDNPELLERIQKAYSVFFSGGNQIRISTLMSGTQISELIKERYENDDQFIVAGTSAGAMVMSDIMLLRGEKTEALLKGEVNISSGLGYIQNCIIDTHFIKRGRIGRLVQAVVNNPNCLGIGLGEDTALVITEGNKMCCIGSGMVVILDGNHLKFTNVVTAEKYTPLCVENLILHILSKGYGFMLREREFICLKETEKTI